MRNVVVVGERAQRDLSTAPRQIASKLKLWANAVETDGLRVVRRIRGYHDEPLKGQRKGQRSIRLSIKWRAIYTTTASGEVELVTVQEVTAHDYRV